MVVDVVARPMGSGVRVYVPLTLVVVVVVVLETR